MLSIQKNSNIDWEPKIIYVNEITKSEVNIFREQIQSAILNDQDILPVVINSSGGCTYSGLAMCNILKTCPLRVITIVIGEACSSAAFLFCMGDDRYMHPGSVVMFHDVNMELDKDDTYTRKEIIEESKEMNRVIHHLFEMSSQSIKQPKDFLWNLFLQSTCKDLYIDTDTCLDHSICTHVGKAILKCSVQVNMSVSLKR
jgi:ATP-dependent protease ClpP protease subunit